MIPRMDASDDTGSSPRLMPHAPARSPFGSVDRSAAGHDGADTGRGAVHRDRTAPTRTVVFFPPVLGGARRRPGRGVVLDEQWSVMARFTAGPSVDMVGACGGLLCLLDVRSCAIRIVSSAVTGESVDVPPPPPCTSARHDPRAYCFGFDATARRYKVVHLPCDHRVVYVHSVGGKHWRPVGAPGAACCLSTGGAVSGDGAVYWLTHYKVAMAKLVRFDLRGEEITTMELPPVDDGRRRPPLYCRLMDTDAMPCVVTSLTRDPTPGKPCNDDIGMWRLGEDGRWGGRRVVQLRRLPWRVPGPRAMSLGHLLLQGEDRALYAHRIDDSGEKVLVGGGSARGRDGSARAAPPDAAWPCSLGEGRVRGSVAVGIVAAPCYRDRLKKSDGEMGDRRREKARADGPAHGGGWHVVRTFGYVEHPVSTAPLAQRRH
ncbi:hypothetical protein ACP70R_006004 [Stipagrostis hirtigluma subsp. patula]